MYVSATIQCVSPTLECVSPTLECVSPTGLCVYPTHQCVFPRPTNTSPHMTMLSVSADGPTNVWMYAVIAAGTLFVIFLAVACYSMRWVPFTCHIQYPISLADTVFICYSSLTRKLLVFHTIDPFCSSKLTLVWYSFSSL